MVIIMPEESGLECRILQPETPFSDLAEFSTAHQQDWSSFFEFTPEQMKRRLDSGGLFVGGYFNGIPIGFLEAALLTIDLDYDRDHKEDLTYAKQIAKLVCEQIRNHFGDYWGIVDKSTGAKAPIDPNAMLMLSINVTRNYRNLGFGSGIINYVKLQLNKPRHERFEQLRQIDFVHTFTPDGHIVRFHQENGAFDSEFIHENARHGYDRPNVRYQIYLAPGFPIKLPKAEPAPLRETKTVHPTPLPLANAVSPFPEV